MSDKKEKVPFNKKYSALFKANKENDMNLKQINDIDPSEIHDENSNNVTNNVTNNDTNEAINEAVNEVKVEEKCEEVMENQNNVSEDIQETNTETKETNTKVEEPVKEVEWYPAYVLECPGLNVRSEPSTNGKILKVLHTSELVSFTSVERNYEWCKIKTGNIIGYCMAKYLVKKSPYYN